MSRLARHTPDDPDGWAAPRLVAEWRFEPERTAARCLCSHSRQNHSAKTGLCWSAACGCKSFRPREDQQ